MDRKVLVCQNVTCHKQDAKKVLAAFRASVPSDVTVEATGCLGHCGNGPTVLILPEEIWYSHLQVSDIPAIVEHHFQPSRSLSAQQYARSQPHNPPQGVWLIASVLGLGLFCLIFWVCSVVMASSI